MTLETRHTPRFSRTALSSGLALCLLFGLLLAGVASADDRGRSIGKRFELTPFASYFFEGEIGTDHDFGFSFRDADVAEGEGAGLLASFRVNRHWQVELMYSEQETEFEFRRFGFFGSPDFVDRVDVDVEYFHIGAAYNWSIGQIEPFVDLTAGTTQISPRGGADSDNFSIGFGGGVKVWIGEHLGFRFQGRILTTDVGRDDFFCEESLFGDCYYYDDDSYFVQPQVSAGLILAF